MNFAKHNTGMIPEILVNVKKQAICNLELVNIKF